MKNLFIIILFAALFSPSYANTQDRMKDPGTSAEEDFISACTEKEAICFANSISGCCVPEVIIIDEHDEIFSKGERENEVIKRFILISDYLTEVQGTEYYRMNTLNPAVEMTGVAQK
jgi:hypothetical protein